MKSVFGSLVSYFTVKIHKQLVIILNIVVPCAFSSQILPHVQNG